jgi:diacylglycerol kinase family enzyme
VEMPDGSVVDDLFYAVVANCDPWTYIGNRPLRPTPQASFDSGLDLYARTRMGALGAIYGLAQMARKHPRPRGWGAMLEHDLTEFVVRADDPIPVQVDGDLLESREKMRFWSIPHAVKVVL